MKLLAVALLAGAVSAYNPYDSIPPEHGDLSRAHWKTTCNCGWIHKKGSSRIVGGTETGVNQFPWVVALVIIGRSKVFCGGSIITPSHVLTAAHCTLDRDPSSIIIVAGKHNFRDMHNTHDTQKITVRSIINHESYNERDVTNDISLVLLEKNIIFSNKVGPVCLPNSRYAFNLVYNYVKILGWGNQWTNGPPSDVLQQVDLRVIPLEICRSSFISIDTLSPTQLCTFSENKDSCQGDSGGPVVYLDPDTNRYTLVGIVSFGKHCAESTPGVNTEVAAYLDWIQRNVEWTDPNIAQTCSKIDPFSYFRFPSFGL